MSSALLVENSKCPCQDEEEMKQFSHSLWRDPSFQVWLPLKRCWYRRVGRTERRETKAGISSGKEAHCLIYRMEDSFWQDQPAGEFSIGKWGKCPVSSPHDRGSMPLSLLGSQKLGWCLAHSQPHWISAGWTKGWQEMKNPLHQSETMEVNTNWTSCTVVIWGLDLHL